MTFGSAYKFRLGMYSMMMRSGDCSIMRFVVS